MSVCNLMQINTKSGEVYKANVLLGDIIEDGEVFKVSLVAELDDRDLEILMEDLESQVIKVLNKKIDSIILTVDDTRKSTLSEYTLSNCYFDVDYTIQNVFRCFISSEQIKREKLTIPHYNIEKKIF